MTALRLRGRGGGGSSRLNSFMASTVAAPLPLASAFAALDAAQADEACILYGKL